MILIFYIFNVIGACFHILEKRPKVDVVFVSWHDGAHESIGATVSIHRPVPFHFRAKCVGLFLVIVGQSLTLGIPRSADACHFTLLITFCVGQFMLKSGRRGLQTRLETTLAIFRFRLQKRAWFTDLNRPGSPRPGRRKGSRPGRFHFPRHPAARQFTRRRYPARRIRRRFHSPSPGSTG